MTAGSLSIGLHSTFLRRYFPVLATAFQVVLDAATILAACFTAYAAWMRMQPLPSVVPLADYLPVFCAITIIELLLFAQFGLYSLQKSILNIEEFRGALKAVVFGFLITVFLHYSLEESLIYPRHGGEGSSLYALLSELHRAVAIVPAQTYSRYVLLLSFVCVYAFVAIQRWICFKGMQYLHLKGVGTTNILIVGTGPLGRTLQKRLFLSPRLGYNVVGFIDPDPAQVGRPVQKARVLAALDELERIVAAFKVGLVLVADSEPDTVRRRWIVAVCRRLEVEVAFVPPLYVADDLPPLRLGTLGTLPLLTPGKVKPGPFFKFGKRVIDVVLSALGILVNLPLFLFLPLLIKLDSKGPVLFRQERVGLEGRPFRIIKFRTMKADQPAYAPSPRTGDDPRLTRVGRWLRRTSLDELPQLLNVLRGDMSIVGPRPEMPFIVARYDGFVRQRLLTKPGMTGLWQISHARDADIHENIDFDLYYVEHPSLTIDCVILILTVFSVIRGVGAR